MREEFSEWNLEGSLREGTRLADEEREAELRAELWDAGIDDSLYEYDRFNRRLVLPTRHGGRY